MSRRSTRSPRTRNAVTLAAGRAVEPLEDRRLFSCNVTPQILLLSAPASPTAAAPTPTVLNGSTINWPAGIALDVRAVDQLDTSTANYSPSATTGSTFANGATPNNSRFAWDFGDTVDTADADTDQLVGFNAAHVYDTDQQFTLKLTVTDQNGVQATTSVRVNVTSGAISTPINGQTLTTGLGPSTADVPASPTGGNIVYVDSGAAAGGTGTLASPLQTFAQAITAYTSAAGTSNPVTQIRLKRGDVFNVTKSAVSDGNQNLSDLLIGAYGASGSDPALNYTDSTTNNIISLAHSSMVTANFTIQDIHFTEGISGGSYATAFAPRGIDITMRRCEFGGDPGTGTYGNMINDVDSGTVDELDGMLLNDNDDLGSTIQQYATVFLGATQDLAIVGNRITGASTQPQPIFRVDTQAGGGGRTLIAKNFVEPTSTAGGAALTIRDTGYYVYVTGNTFEGLVNVGNGTSAPTGPMYEWVVFDSNLTVGGSFTFNEDELHLTYENNVDERYAQTGNAAFAEVNGLNNISSPETDYGTSDVALVNNTLYVDLSSGSASAEELTNVTQSYTIASTGQTLPAVTGLTIADNLVEDPIASYSRNYNASLYLYSPSQLTADYDNVLADPQSSPTGSDARGTGTPVNGESNLVSVGGTAESVDAWNANGRSTVGTAFTGVAYDDLSRAVVISADSSASSQTASYAVTSGNAEVGSAYAGNYYDYYGNLRPTSTATTVGAVQTAQLTVTPASAQAATAGASKSFSLGSFTAYGATAPYAVDVSWGDGTTDTTFTLSAAGAIPAQAHTYAAAGTDTVTVTVTDSASHASNAATFAATVAAAGAAKLAGTAIGTPGSYGNRGNVGANALDGDLTTYYDAYDASGDWVGLDLGQTYHITGIAYAGRSGFGYRMDGGMFQASNTADFSSGVVTLYTVGSNENPPSSSLTTRTVDSVSGYEYVRYIGPTNGECDVSEVQFFGAQALPGAYSDADVGSTSPAGSATYAASTGTFTLSGGGSDIYGTADSFNYASQTLAGDGTIAAQVNSLTDTSTQAKAGVMFRASSAAGSAEADMVIEPNGYAQFEYRSATGGSTVVYQLAGFGAGSYVKLVRTGGTGFAGYASTDGVNWTLVDSTTVGGLSGTLMDGLVVCSHANGTAATATFSNVAITGS